MKASITWVIAALPVIVRALAINADTGPGNLERRNPIYPTKVTVRGLPAYPTRVTVRGKRDVAATPVVADQGDVEGEAVKGLEARAPPKITLKTVRAKRDAGECTLKSTTTVEGDRPYETVICQPCPPGRVCPAVCIPITTTITPTPKPSTSVICRPCPAGRVCPAICIFTTVTLKPEPTGKPTTSDCCPPGAQCFAPCSLPTPRETA